MPSPNAVRRKVLRSSNTGSFGRSRTSGYTDNVSNFKAEPKPRLSLSFVDVGFPHRRPHQIVDGGEAWTDLWLLAWPKGYHCFSSSLFYWTSRMPLTICWYSYFEHASFSKDLCAVMQEAAVAYLFTGPCDISIKDKSGKEGLIQSAFGRLWRFWLG
jgi:hypothetical protein